MPADFIPARVCILICEIILTLPNHVPIAIHVSLKEYEAITTSPTDRRARLKGQ